MSLSQTSLPFPIVFFCNRQCALTSLWSSDQPLLNVRNLTSYSRNCHSRTTSSLQSTQCYSTRRKEKAEESSESTSGFGFLCMKSLMLLLSACCHLKTVWHCRCSIWTDSIPETSQCLSTSIPATCQYIVQQPIQIHDNWENFICWGRWCDVIECSRTVSKLTLWWNSFLTLCNKRCIYNSEHGFYIHIINIEGMSLKFTIVIFKQLAGPKIRTLGQS